MKKGYIVLPLILVTSLLGSCKGLFTNCDNAKKIIDNIEDKYDSGGISIDRFSSVYDSKTDSTSYYAYNIYDKEEKYYHYYEVDNTGTYEFWTYAKNNKDGKYCLYVGDRTNGATFPDGPNKGKPKVELTVSSYDEEIWKSTMYIVEGVINMYLDYAIKRTNEAIAVKRTNDGAVQLSSMNNTSLCTEGTISDEWFSIIFDNSKLTSFETKVDDKNYRKFNVDYRKSQINYLDEDLYLKNEEPNKWY